MKTFIFSLLLAFSFVSINSSPVMSASWESGLGGQITVPKAGMFDPLINIYNKLIDVTKKSIKNNMDKVTKSASRLLGTMAGAYIVIMGTRSLISGRMFFTDLMEKMFAFLCLTALLEFNYYNKYILSNLETLFNDLPSLFSSGGGNIISNIVTQNSELVDEIWKQTSGNGWGLDILAMLIGALAIISISLLTLVVLINVLIATVKFYFVLSLSSILILLYFFKFTRSYSIGAVQIVFGSILKITCLSLFLNLFGGIIKESLVFNGEEEIFSACMGVILVSSVGMIMLSTINMIANRITGGVSGLAGSKMPSVGNAVKNLMGR